MTITINDPETEHLVRDLAQRLQVEPAEAVRLASEAALSHGTAFSIDRVEVDAALRRLHELPVVDPRSPNEILDELMEDGLR